MKKEEKKKLKKFYLVLAVIIFMDQFSKALVVHYGEMTLITDKMVLKSVEIQNGIYDETDFRNYKK